MVEKSANQLEQVAADCRFLACGFFYLEDIGDTFLRNRQSPNENILDGRLSQIYFDFPP
jgi:hypothetical protein